MNRARAVGLVAAALQLSPRRRVGGKDADDVLVSGPPEGRFLLGLRRHRVGSYGFGFNAGAAEFVARRTRNSIAHRKPAGEFRVEPAAPAPSSDRLQPRQLARLRRRLHVHSEAGRVASLARPAPPYPY